jgi:DNA-binding transcriptional regulator YhcF (GntR family)
MTTTTTLKPVAKDRKIEQKWGPDLAASGWTGIPNVLFQRQKALGLTPLDVNIILQLAAYWWEPSNLPHPSKKSIAAAIGVDPRTVQKRVAAMEAAKFIKRIERRTSRGSRTNLYDFSGLIAAAQPFAKEELEEIVRRKKEKAEKLERKRPRLSVVS